MKKPMRNVRFSFSQILGKQKNVNMKSWLALPVGNESPSTFTGWYIGDETSLIPYEPGQLGNHGCGGRVIPGHASTTTTRHGTTRIRKHHDL